MITAPIRLFCWNNSAVVIPSAEMWQSPRVNAGKDFNSNAQAVTAATTAAAVLTDTPDGYKGVMPLGLTSLNYIDGKSVYEHSDYADHYANGPYTASVIDWVTAYATTLKNLGVTPDRIVLDEETNASVFSGFWPTGAGGQNREDAFQAVWDDAAAFGNIPKAWVTDLLAPADFRTNADKTASGPPAVWNGYENWRRAQWLKKDVADVFTTVFGQAIPTTNFRDLIYDYTKYNADVIRDNNAQSEIHWGAVSNQSSPRCYTDANQLFHPDKTFPYEDIWHQFLYWLRGARLCRRPIDGVGVVPWVSNPGRIGSNDNANPWINVEQFRHLRAMGCNDFLYFNNITSTDQVMQDAINEVDGIVERVPPTTELPDIDITADQVTTGSYRTTRSDYLANGL